MRAFFCLNGDPSLPAYNEIRDCKTNLANASRVCQVRSHQQRLYADFINFSV
jgi:hypothetical protein